MVSKRLREARQGKRDKERIRTKHIMGHRLQGVATHEGANSIGIEVGHIMRKRNVQIAESKEHEP